MGDNGLFGTPRGEGRCPFEVTMLMQCDEGGKVTIHEVVTGNSVPSLMIGQAAPFNGGQFRQLTHPELMYVLSFNEVFIHDCVTAIKVGDDDRLIDDVLDRDGGVFHEA